MEIQKIGDGRIVIDDDTYVNENRPRVLTVKEYEEYVQLKLNTDSNSESNSTTEHVNDYTIENMLEIANYGFKLAKESSESFVPMGNMLQHIMYIKKLINVPKQWKKYKDWNNG